MSHSSGCTAWRSPLRSDISCCGPHAYCLAGDKHFTSSVSSSPGASGRGHRGSEGRTQSQALAQCSACSPNCTSSQSQGGKRHVELCQQTLPLWRLPPPYNTDEASTYCVPTTRPGSRRQRVDRTDEAVPCGAQTPPAPRSPEPRLTSSSHPHWVSGGLRTARQCRSGTGTAPRRLGWVGQEACESEGAGDTGNSGGTQECSGAWAGVNPAWLEAVTDAQIITLCAVKTQQLQEGPGSQLTRHAPLGKELSHSVPRFPFL